MLLKKKFEEDERIFLKILSIGLILVSCAILIENLLPPFPLIKFFTGLMMGISIVFNIFSLYWIGRLHRQVIKKNQE